jgi:glycyl-tRNA synthetase
MADLEHLDTIISLCKKRGFIFQSSEIYGGLAATYDYGPLGVELKRNIRDAWWKAMTQKHDNVEGIDAAILMHPKTWEASGHVDSFNDPMIDDKQSKMRYRADTLIEGYIMKLRDKGKEDEANRVQGLLDTAGSRNGLAKDLYDIIIEEEIRSPDSGAFDWTDVRQFNLMFKTQFGSISSDEDDSAVYLRPETAQGIFVNFTNVQQTSRQQVPFGIAQIGKAFRNEIVARQFVFRMREFEQMEMQYFVEPGTDEDNFENWKAERLAWHKSIGIREKNLRFADHPEDKLAHYAKGATDIQFKYPIGWQEIEGIHNRTDFDLSQHQEFSGKKQEYFDPHTQKRYIPYVIETSVGLDRTILMTLCDAYREEETETANGKTEKRTVLKLHPKLAPVTVGIMPLIKKDELQDIAHKLKAELSEFFKVQYDEKGSVGKRYRRFDEGGTPFCVTVDFDGLEDQTVTVRDRDTMEQDRVALSEVENYIREKIKTWKPED